LLKGGESRRGAVRGDDGERVRLEGEGGDVSPEAADDGLVSEMDAVEDADGQSGHARVGVEFGEGNGTDEHNVTCGADAKPRGG
jgi:hypothetical protein